MSQAEKTIWALQEALRQWHDQEYKQEYPNSKFYTGRDLAEPGLDWDALSSEEQERRERRAYRLNSMMFSMGVNVSGNFREG